MASDRKPHKTYKLGVSRDDGHLVLWAERCCDECYSGPWTYRRSETEGESNGD